MEKIIRLLLVLVLVSLTLAACDSLEVSGTPPPGRMPCVTATPSRLEAVSATAVVAAPAGVSSPAGGSEDTPSPEELATREAQLGQQNRPVEVPEGGGTSQPTLPVCPTPTQTPPSPTPTA